MIVLINFCGPECKIYRDSTAASKELGMTVEVFRRRLIHGWFYENGILVMGGEYICSPLDMENRFNDMWQGSYKQGGYKPLQMGFLRPNEQCSQVKTPIKNLYLCGASCNPGGMVTFGAGYLGAQVVAKELGAEQWWQEPDFIAEYKKTYGFE